MPDLWKQEAMRLGGESFVEVIVSVHNRLESIETGMKARDAEIALLKDAFPSNDMGGHRRYHEVLIANLEERRKLRIAVQEKTISGAVWALMVFVGLACWEYFKTKVR